MEKLVAAEIEDYACAHGRDVPDLMDELRDYTHAHMDLPQMLVGPIEGNFLKVLVRATGARRIVEVGTFTGYSGLMMASGLPEDGSLITCELEDAHADVAQKFFDRSSHGRKITIARGKAAETLASLEGPFDMAFIDADKAGYITYFDLLLPRMRPGGLIVVDNVLWSGRVLEPADQQNESTRAIVAFNNHVQAMADLDKVMLTVRDGMTLIVAP